MNWKKNVIRQLLCCQLCSFPIAIQAQGNTVEKKDYSRLSISLISAQPIASNQGVQLVSNHSLRGIGMSYLYGLNLTRGEQPLYLEFGPECSFVSRTDDIDYWDGGELTLHDEVCTQMIWLSSPLNVAYHYRLNDALTLAPSAGLTLKANLLSTVKSEEEKIDLMDEGAHRFQLGWNAGAGLYYHRWYIGMRYDLDITPFVKEGKSKERFGRIECSVGKQF